MLEQLIEDVIPFEYTLEESASSGNLLVKGVFQRADVLNENNRVYPRGLWEKTLANDRILDSINNRAMFGETDHPSTGKTALSRVSHLVTNLNLIDNGDVIGEAEILDTPNGKILKTLFESGTRVGISSRGSGSVQTRADGAKQVQEDFKLSTFDFVARPSTLGALPQVAAKKRSVREEANAIPADTTMPVVPRENDDFKVLTVLGADINIIVEDIKTSPEMSPEEVGLYSGELMELSNRVMELYDTSPEYKDLLQEMLNNIDIGRSIMNGEDIVTTDNSIQEDHMDRKELIRSRLQKIISEDVEENEFSENELRDQLNDMDDDELLATADEMGLLNEEVSEEDELRTELNTMNDDELLNTAGELGLLDENEENEEIDVENLVEYTQELEQELARVTDIAEQLSEALEETEDEGLGLKYEAALGVIAEMAAEFDQLVEAVGGEESANKLVEAYNEKQETTANKDEKQVNEDLSNITNIEEAMGNPTTTANRAVELADKAIKKLGYK